MIQNTDRYPYEDYELIKKKINDFHGNSNGQEVIMFANPCTMQVVLSHFDQVSLTTHRKTKNSPLIEELTGIADYDAHSDQRDALIGLISIENYQDMKQNLSQVHTADTEVPSTNFHIFLNRLENGESSWIDEINNKLEE